MIMTHKKIYKCDLHIHTNYSFDSLVTMEQYVLKAIELGLDAICFTDHIDINRHYNTFATFDFDGRMKEFERIKGRYGDKLQLLLGFEMGEPHLHVKETAFLRSLSPDMIIGSIHYPTDYEPEDAHFTRREYERLYDRYVRQMVQDGDFDVLGHMDMPKKYHSDYVSDLDYVRQTLKMCVQRNIVPEINTSSVNFSGATMPSLDAISYYQSVGGKYVTINSDSHNLATLGNGVQLLDKLPDGLEQCYFAQGKIMLF